MIYLKKFYLIPWTIWCGLTFLILNFIFFPFLYIFLITKNKTLYHYAHFIPNIIGRASSFLWGLNVKVEGLQNIDTKAQYIFVGNHRSFIDAIVSAAYIRNPKKYIGKAEILSWPFLGYILKNLYIPVKRDDKNSRKSSMEQLIIKMKEGYSMIVFAEGKTNTSQEPLLPFKDGAFNTSCEAKIPIAPFVLYGADILWPREAFLIKPGKILLRFLPVQNPLDNTESSIQTQKEMVREIMLKNYSELERQY